MISIQMLRDAAILILLEAGWSGEGGGGGGGSTSLIGSCSGWKWIDFSLSNGSSQMPGWRHAMLIEINQFHAFLCTW